MQILIILIISGVTLLLIKEKLEKNHIEEPCFKAIESYHMQWLGISILWFIAGVFFTVAYINDLSSGASNNESSLLIAILYFYIGIVYVVRGFSKDIISKSCLWTSKGKIYWQDVSTCKIINDEETEEVIYLQIIAKQKTLLMKFNLEDRASLELLIEKAWYKL